MPKYLGPAVTYELGGKVYQRGDNVSISGEDQRRAERAGHRFEGTEAVAAAGEPAEDPERGDPDRGIPPLAAVQPEGTGLAAAPMTEEQADQAAEEREGRRAQKKSE